jgi:hypothetical protein
MVAAGCQSRAERGALVDGLELMVDGKKARPSTIDDEPSTGSGSGPSTINSQPSTQEARRAANHERTRRAPEQPQHDVDKTTRMRWGGSVKD